MPPTPDDRSRRQRIIAGFQGRTLQDAAAQPGMLQDMQDEANSADAEKLVSQDLVELAKQATAVRESQPHLALFETTDDVILVPGFLGSELIDIQGPDGLIWIDPGLVFGTGKLNDLKLAEYRAGQSDQDANDTVMVRPNGAIPILYAGLKYGLDIWRFNARVFGFDWRKDTEEAATALAQQIRNRAGQRFRPLHLVAHSQGSLVARRALQLAGADIARRLVNNLVLLGPASGGTFSAAFAIAGANSFVETIRRFHVSPPNNFAGVLQSMTGLYQLLPWQTKAIDGMPVDGALTWMKENPGLLRSADFWQPSGVDRERLQATTDWARSIDTGFFSDRTSIILGEKTTPGGVKFDQGKLVEDTNYASAGDGTVPDSMARLPGVDRVYRASNTEHMMLPATLSVITAVRDILSGRLPSIQTAPPGIAAAEVARLAEPRPAKSPVAAAAGPAAERASQTNAPAIIADVDPPPHRRLRVFSFDPLFATELESMGVSQVTVDLPWSGGDGEGLRPGPVGEYLEVVDFDPPQQCFYRPIDLNHSYLLARDGLPPSEGDPRFHQQMVYAVAMKTIRNFERSLGRSALWAPRLQRDAHGEVMHRPPEQQFVRRLRIYPHAMSQPNAYYDPEKKSLLFGYFPATGSDVGRNLPGGTIFTCLSYDVVAHETTHALLDGLHRYLTEPSNPDVFAFHEAFADIVALFQHFSHPEVLREQIARSRGDMDRESMLGALAAQFGEAQGKRGALRQYLGARDENGEWKPIVPDPRALSKSREPHTRGAILVAALFRAFKNIYESRVQDLRRIATHGSGILPQGDLHPDLVARLAAEAAKAASHMLNMSIRALDYIPPVDLTFGEYLRALITADYDLVRDDDLRYRIAVVSAFREWGIYPSDVRAMSVDSLLWLPPEPGCLHGLSKFLADFLRGCQLDDWDLANDRYHACHRMDQLSAVLHDSLTKQLAPGEDYYLGLYLQADAAAAKRDNFLSIRRDAAGNPVFEVPKIRPCRRIGPDGQQCTDAVVEIVQRRKAYFDDTTQQAVDSGAIAYDDKNHPQDFYFRGGCTLLVDPKTGSIRYCVRKSIRNNQRLALERRFRGGEFGDAGGGAYLAPNGGDSQYRPNPFAFLHGGY